MATSYNGWNRKNLDTLQRSLRSVNRLLDRGVEYGGQPFSGFIPTSVVHRLDVACFVSVTVLAAQRAERIHGAPQAC